MTPAWDDQDNDTLPQDDVEDLYDMAHALKMRLQGEIRKGNAKGIGDYFYLSDNSHGIILSAMVKAIRSGQGR